MVTSGVMGAGAVERDCAVVGPRKVVVSSVETEGKADDKTKDCKGNNMGVKETKGDGNKNVQEEKDRGQDHAYSKREEKKQQEKELQPQKDTGKEKKPPSRTARGGGMASNKEQPPVLKETQQEENHSKQEDKTSQDALTWTGWGCKHGGR